MATASDNFNRADGYLGANWTDTVAGGAVPANALTVFGNAVRSQAAYQGAYWSAASFDDDQFSQLEYALPGGAAPVLDPGEWMGVTVRTHNPGGGEGSYLAILFNDGSGGGHYDLILFSQAALTFTALAAAVTIFGPGFAPSVGDRLKITAQGTTIRVFYNEVQKIAVTDATYTSGAPGILFYGAVPGDNWYGGDAVVPAFPTTPVIDNFNRAGGASAGGTACSDGLHTWAGTTINGDVDGGHIVSNTVQTVAGATDLYVATDFGPDTEVYMDLPDAPPSAEYAFLAARVQDEGTATWDGYGLIWINGTGWQLRKYTNGSSTPLGATENTYPLADGDSVGLEIVGSTLTAYRKTGGFWEAVMSRTDSTYSAAGVIGYELSNGTLDNFGGGTVGGVAAQPRFQSLVIA